MKNVQAKIDQQEVEDYQIVSKIYSSICEDYQVVNAQTPPFWAYDMSTSAITQGNEVFVWDTEIKNLTKEFNYFIIKVDKIVNMLRMSFHRIFLCYLMGGKAYLFDVRSIQFNALDKIYIQANKVQYDASKGQDSQLHYKLPKELAYKVIDYANIE